jgi:cellobiose phosphorylase
LVIAPVVPKSWSRFKVTRKFRGVTYDIAVERKGSGNQVALEVNGAAIAGNRVPQPPAGTKTASVKVTLH